MTSLFGAMDRDYAGPADYGEPAFSFLNRSSSPESRRIRNTLEAWFARYPADQKDDLGARLRSPIDKHHLAALLELTLHEAFSRLSLSIELHPKLSDRPTTPDFLVGNSSQSLYVEATVNSGVSEAQAAATARLQSVYNVINRNVHDTRFFVWLEVESDPMTSPPARQIADFIERDLRALDPDIIAAHYENGRYDLVPTWVYSVDGWSISVRPIPKKPEAYGRSSGRPIGVLSSGVHKVDDVSPLRASLQQKCSKYGRLSMPYVIAVGNAGPVDRDSIASALFGDERYLIETTADGPVEPPIPEFTRERNGLWTGRTGPRNTRVSGVLVANSLSLWSIARMDCRLYLNPWAVNTCRLLTEFPRTSLEGSRLVDIEGMEFSGILGIPRGWPGDAA